MPQEGTFVERMFGPRRNRLGSPRAPCTQEKSKTLTKKSKEGGEFT